MFRSLNKQLDDMQRQLLLKYRDRHLECGVRGKHLRNLVPGSLVNQLQEYEAWRSDTGSAHPDAG
jgi:hypothetical protein